MSSPIQNFIKQTEDNGHGVLKHAFKITGIVNRIDFGMTWNKLTDTGGLGLGENVKLIANIQVEKLVEETSAMND